MKTPTIAPQRLRDPAPVPTPYPQFTAIMDTLAKIRADMRRTDESLQLVEACVTRIAPRVDAAAAPVGEVDNG